MNFIAALCEKYLKVNKSIQENFLANGGDAAKFNYLNLSAEKEDLKKQIKTLIKTSFSSDHHAHVLVDLIWHGMPVHNPEKEQKLLRCLIDVLNA